MRIKVNLDEKTFIRFGLFNAFSRQRIWRRPALFAAILGAAAAVCFVLHQRRGAVLLGSVLLIVALGLPAAWFLSYYLSLRGQARAQELYAGKYVYTLLLSPEDGLVVDNGREHVVCPWDKLYHIHRSPRATYLYITPQRAVLIPHACVKGGGEGLWEQLGRCLPGRA